MNQVSDGNERERLLKIVNASGFAFQLGVEHHVWTSASEHGWDVVSREHAWSGDGRSGFADLLLAKEHMRLVVECKRVKGGTWVFLVGKNAEPKPRVRVQWSDAKPDQDDLVGFHEFFADPIAPESDFCAVRGSGEKHRPMLERIASGVLTSLEPLAKTELELPSSRTDGVALIHIPIIVTNASLVLCRFDPSAVSIDAGDLDEAQFEEVPFLRFRKSLAFDVALSDRRRTLAESAANNERTVLVSTGADLPKLLARLDVPLPAAKAWPAATFRRWTTR